MECVLSDALQEDSGRGDCGTMRAVFFSLKPCPQKEGWMAERRGVTYCEEWLPNIWNLTMVAGAALPGSAGAASADNHGGRGILALNEMTSVTP